MVVVCTKCDKKTVFYFFSTLKEKDVLEQMIMDGVSRLKTAIISLHQKLCIGEKESREMGTILEKEEDEEGASGSSEMPRDISVDELMGNIASIEDEANLLQERNDSLQTYVKHYPIRDLITFVLKCVPVSIFSFFVDAS